MADWIFTQLYQLFSMPARLHHIGIITSCIAKYVTNSNAGIFRHPVLSDTEHVEGCKFGIGYWVDTLCAGKHVFVVVVIESILITHYLREPIFNHLYTKLLVLTSTTKFCHQSETYWLCLCFQSEGV